VKIIVTGAGGFLGGALTTRLVADGHHVMAIARKHRDHWWQCPSGMQVLDKIDLLHADECEFAFTSFEADQCYHLAAAMGGRAFTHGYDAACAMNAALDLNVFTSFRGGRLFYASSACAELESGEADGLYGEAKRYAERALQAISSDRGYEARVARLYGAFGPHGDWKPPRAKAPADLIRKALEAVGTHNRIEVWGNGQQRRSYLYVDDAVDGMIATMNAGSRALMTIASDEVVTIGELARECAVQCNVPTRIQFVAGPVGPLDRTPDTFGTKAVLGWAPKVSLAEGIARTIPWIKEQMNVARVPDEA